MWRLPRCTPIRARSWWVLGWLRQWRPARTAADVRGGVLGLRRDCQRAVPAQRRQAGVLLDVFRAAAWHGHGRSLRRARALLAFLPDATRFRALAFSRACT